MEYGTDYQDVRHERTTEQIETFFAPSQFQFRTFEYQQEFDYPALEGRLLSSSYTPQPGETRYAPMLRELRRIFDAHQVDGRVAFEYDTRVFTGSRLDLPAGKHQPPRTRRSTKEERRTGQVKEFPARSG